MVNPIAQALTQPFIWSRGGAALTPEQVAREREVAEALMAGAIDTSPVGHWLQGAARMANAAVGNIRKGRADAAEKSGKEAFASRFSNIFGGGSDVSPSLAGSPATSTAMATQPAPANAAAVTAQNTPAPRFTGGKQEFIDMLMPGAIEASRRTGIDPRIIIAQSAQETGWGKSAPGNNYFGIKSHGKGGGQTFKTHEYVDGKRVNINDSFRQYESPEDSALGYAEFIAQNPRYKPLMAAQGLDAQLEALQASGYATDPNYSRSVGAIARGIAMPEMASAADAVAANEVMASGDPVTVAETPEQILAAEQAMGMGAALPDAQFDDRFNMGGIPAPEMRDGTQLPGAQQFAQDRMAGMAPPMAAPQTISDMPVADIAQSLTRNAVNPDLPMMGNTSGFAPVAQSLAQQGPQQPQYNTQDLVAAISDPWASKEQRAIATALLEQQMQQQDPYRQAQLQKMQLEIQQMSQPQRSALMNAGNGQIYDPNSDRWILAPGGDQQTFRQAAPEEAAKYGAVGGQFGPDGRFYPINPPAGMNIQMGPDGTFTFEQGPGVQQRPLTEAQSKDAVYATRAEGALPLLDQFGDALADPIQRAAEYDPTGVLRGQQTPEFQQARQAGDEFLQAILRKDTGAAITTGEMESYGRTYLPMPGDGPQVLAQKKVARARALEAMKSGMPPQAILNQEEALRKSGSTGAVDKNKPISEMTDEELEALANGNG